MNSSTWVLLQWKENYHSFPIKIKRRRLSHPSLHTSWIIVLLIASFLRFSSFALLFLRYKRWIRRSLSLNKRKNMYQDKNYLRWLNLWKELLKSHHNSCRINSKLFSKNKKAKKNKRRNSPQLRKIKSKKNMKSKNKRNKPKKVLWIEGQ